MQKNPNISSENSEKEVQGEAFKKFMRRDMQEIARYMALLKQEALEHLHPARLGAGALSSMAQLLKAAGLALQSLSQKTEDALTTTPGKLLQPGR